MSDAPINPEEAQDIKVSEVKTSLQALANVWQGMSFLLANYRKTVYVVIVLLFLMVSQFFTNFEQVKQLTSLFGGQ